MSWYMYLIKVRAPWQATNGKASVTNKEMALQLGKSQFYTPCSFWMLKLHICLLNCSFLTSIRLEKKKFPYMNRNTSISPCDYHIHISCKAYRVKLLWITTVDPVGDNISRKRTKSPFGGSHKCRQAEGVSGSLLAADHLVLVVLACERLQRGLNNPTTEPEHEVERGLLLDVVVRQSAAILQLLPGEDQTLLVRRDSYARGKN
jgi:hypothetical protein